MNTLEVTPAKYSLTFLHTEKQQTAQVRTVFSQEPTIKNILFWQELAVSFYFPVTPLAISGTTMTGLGKSHCSHLEQIHVYQRIARGQQRIMTKARFCRFFFKERPILLCKKAVRGKILWKIRGRAIRPSYIKTQYFCLINGRNRNEIFGTANQNNSS